LWTYDNIQNKVKQKDKYMIIEIMFLKNIIYAYTHTNCTHICKIYSIFGDFRYSGWKIKLKHKNLFVCEKRKNDVPGGMGRIFVAVLTSDIRRGRAVIMPSSSTICNTNLFIYYVYICKLPIWKK